MTVKTLSEAAADVLAQSKANADKEEMHKLPGTEVQDLGGSTIEKPEGNAVGQEASAKVTQAAKPGPAPKIGADPMKKLGEEIEEEDVTVTPEQIRAMTIEKMKTLSVAEDVAAMFAGQELSEDFIKKATTIFEAAVIERAVLVVEQLEQDIMEAAQESVDSIKQELEEQMSAYSEYVAKEWLQENRLAVQSGLKAELVEGFMEGLKDLFAEHYIDLPEDKVDIVEALTQEVQETRDELNEAINANVHLLQQINEAKKEQLTNSVCEGLTATQAEKVKSLAESIEFSTEAEYVEKVKVIKESYFTGAPVKTVQSDVANKELIAEETAQFEVGSSPLMDQYVNAITRTQIK